MVAVTDDAVKISQFGKLLIFTTYVIATLIGLTYDLIDWIGGIMDLSSTKRKVLEDLARLLTIFRSFQVVLCRVWRQ